VPCSSATKAVATIGVRVTLAFAFFKTFLALYFGFTYIKWHLLYTPAFDLARLRIIYLLLAFHATFMGSLLLTPGTAWRIQSADLAHLLR
jgi:hypothetical protein